MKDHDITPIDLVVVNLYPFQQTIAKPNVTLAEAIENIDIGGPCMVRASAKNNKYVAIVTNPDKYSEIISILQKDGAFSDEYRLELAQEPFIIRPSTIRPLRHIWLNRLRRGLQSDEGSSHRRRRPRTYPGLEISAEPECRCPVRHSRQCSMADVAKCVDISLSDLEGIADYAVSEGIDMLVVGPEVPLTEGLATWLRPRA